MTDTSSSATSAPATPVPTPERIPVRRALVSVYDKSGLVELATALVGSGVEIVSTGSTAKTIAAAGLPVTAVEDVTGFPECLDGRVKTLHPKVHAGLLADLRLESHRSQLDELGIAPVPAAGEQPLPLHPDRRLRARRRTSASSRSTSAGRRWCGPAPRTTRAWPSSPPRSSTAS